MEFLYFHDILDRLNYSKEVEINNDIITKIFEINKVNNDNYQRDVLDITILNHDLKTIYISIDEFNNQDIIESPDYFGPFKLIDTEDHIINIKILS